MRVVRFDEFGAQPYVTEVRDPAAPAGGVVIRVSATGVCRSDWHGWQGHDPDIRVLPHVPGHEFAGVITELGAGVQRCRVGDRVTVPFVCACGTCTTCAAGNGQVCPHQWQPGFSGPGSFAELVAIPFADANVVSLPEEVSDVTAAALGCRFATAYRAVTRIGGVLPGETVAVLGCGGVGLSAVMIATALGARVVAVDTNPEARDRATAAGAIATLDPRTEDVVARLHDLAPGGVDVGIDALGSIDTAATSVASLRPRGRHVQVGLLPPAVTMARESIPMHIVISRELAVLGSHGMPASDYPEMLSHVSDGTLRPADLVSRVIGLADVPDAMAAMQAYDGAGITVCVP